MSFRKDIVTMSEECLDCRFCEVIEYGAKGFLGETILECRICEDSEADKSKCFEPKKE